MEQVIIIGASAAGISSALYLARRGIMPFLIAYNLGGEMALSGEVGNYPGFGNTNGWELTQKFLAHAKLYSVEPVLGLEVKKISRIGNGFLIKAWQGEGKREISYKARTVIIASGSHPRELNVLGEREFRGKGVSYCTVCDGPLFKNKTTVTIGGGDSASESGIMMNEIASKAYVVTKNPEMKGDPSLIRRLKESPNVEIIFNALTTRIFGDEFVKGIEYKDLITGDLKTISAEGVFIHIGMVPNADFVMPELKRNQQGEIVIDKLGRTNIPGVFAAGDVTDTPYKQIGIAVGQGITAALSCVDYLNKLS